MPDDNFGHDASPFGRGWENAPPDAYTPPSPPPPSYDNRGYERDQEWEQTRKPKSTDHTPTEPRTGGGPGAAAGGGSGCVAIVIVVVGVIWWSNSGGQKKEQEGEPVKTPTTAKGVSPTATTPTTRPTTPPTSVAPKPVATTGWLVVRGKEKLLANVSAYLEVGGKRAVDWPVGGSEARVQLPTGTHKVTLRSRAKVTEKGKVAYYYFKSEFEVEVVGGKEVAKEVGKVDPDPNGQAYW